MKPVMKQVIHAVGLDIGSSKVRCVIGEWNEKGLVDVVGIGEADSRGLRRGIVTKSEAVTESITKAVEEAERLSGLEIQLVTTNLSGEHLKGENKHGVVAVTGAEREISAEDVERVIESASAMQLEAGWEIVDRLPQEFIVDGQDGILEPVGMRGARLEAKVHVVTSPGVGRQNALKAINRAQLDVESMALEQLSAAEAVLTDDDREYGAAVINIGSEITGVIIFQGGTVRHTSVFPFGGMLLTKDLAVGMRVSIPDAEKIKKEYGSVAGFSLSEGELREVIEVTPVGRNQPRQLTREILCGMLQPRAEEVLQHIAAHIKRAFGDRQLSSGIVLTGGGSALNGMVDIAEHIFDAPTRLGLPALDRFSGLVDKMQSPEWAAVAGLALTSIHAQVSESRGGGGLKSSTQRVAEWFSNIREKFR
jgi:cell division protein FtsA